MYNLLVSSSAESWDGEPFRLEIGRCVREFTEDAIIKSYGNLTKTQVNTIRRFPCIFAYEAFCKKDPKFGLIREITKRQGQVRIDYEIKELDRFLSHTELSEMSFDLDIGKSEMSRTHWAIKKVNLAMELEATGIILPAWARGDGRAVDLTKHEFDVALSFPGEIREYVKSIALELERILGPNSYFYDDNYTAQLARPSLDTLLQDIYYRSKMIVVFLSKAYQEKEWCGIEFRTIKEIIMERKYERVMFVKMSEGDIQGVLKTDGYIDGHRYSPQEIARFIQDRLMPL